MRSFSATCERVAATTKKLEKVAIVADHLRELAPADAALAAVYFSGRAFPAAEEKVLNVGGALLGRVIGEISGASEAVLSRAYRKYGDLGGAAEEVLAMHTPTHPLVLSEVNTAFHALAAASGQQRKSELLRGLFQSASPLEAKYLVKIITGDLRIGLKESLVEEAIAKAYGEEYSAVRRANMMLGDIGATVRLAAEHRLGDAQMRLFHPIGMMLASPIENAAEAFAYLAPETMQIEDKYDGIRAQVHADRDQVNIFSRTLDEISGGYPELAAALRGFVEPVVLDGEIVAWDIEHRRALPFTALQQRLGRKLVTVEMVRTVPVAYLAFDVLYADAKLLIDTPLQARRALLERVLGEQRVVPNGIALPPVGKKKTSAQAGLFDSAPIDEDKVPISAVRAAPIFTAKDANALNTLFDGAQARGNEGLVLKDTGSPYSPGRRGKAWLKLKRELATLDVVVTGVEWGHGKRAKVLSDYTFAVRDDESGKLLNVGKAYSGLTDAEIAIMTEWFQQHTLQDSGYFRTVEPRIVLEVAFNNVMESDRHESGYALRFPRILRIREDKPVEEIDTVARVKELFTKQFKNA